MKKNVASLVVWFFFMVFLGGPAVAHASEHRAYVAGQFYPSDPLELTALLNRLIQTPDVQLDADPQFLLVPHAGYIYSGGTAGKAFALLKSKTYSLVIVIAVNHRNALRSAVLDTEGTFSTPLGKVSIDSEAARRLMDLSADVKEDHRVFMGEHSLEVELPFLQMQLSGFKLLPLLMTVPDLKVAASVGKAVAALIREREAAGQRTLVVISTDFAHYPHQADAVTSDTKMIEQILRLDPEALAQASQQQMGLGIPNLATTMCGEAGVLAGLYAMKSLGDVTAKLIEHSTSGSSPAGNLDEVVGYAAIVFTRKGSVKPAQEKQALSNDDLSIEQKKLLLKVARQSVESHISAGSNFVLPQVKDPNLLKPRAVFVTLKKMGQLRGCIGTLTASRPLIEAVAHYSVLAATQDSRFHPVSKDELSKIAYEVSVLSEPRRVSRAEDIRPGTDGVILKKGGRSGVFLPQVWEDFGMDKERFMDELSSQKAGLPPEAWKLPDAQLYVFQVEAFDEESSGQK